MTVIRLLATYVHMHMYIVYEVSGIWLKSNRLNVKDIQLT